jgi:hypothetical protein
MAHKRTRRETSRGSLKVVGVDNLSLGTASKHQTSDERKRDFIFHSNILNPSQ